MDRATNPNCYPHLEGSNKSLLVGDIEEEDCEETDKLLQNQNKDTQLDPKLKESILSLLKSELVNLDSRIKAAIEEKQMKTEPRIMKIENLVSSLTSEFEKCKQDIESNCNYKEASTKLEELHGSEENHKVQHETTDNMNLRANSKTKKVEGEVDEEHEESIEFSFEEDVYSLMMFSPFCSLIYWTGLLVFVFQMFLVQLLYLSLHQYTWEIVDGRYQPVSEIFIPFGVSGLVRVGQYLVAFLSIVFQTDIHDAIHYCLLLRKGNQSSWNILAENQASSQEASDVSIIRSVYIPNLLRLCEGCATLWIVTIIIKKNDDFFDLLMNFTAIYIVSEMDNVIFKLIRKGFCPCFYTVKAAATIEDVKFRHIYKSNERWVRVRNTVIIRSLVLIGSSLYLLSEVAMLQRKQDNGVILREAYRDCYVDRPDWIGDGRCHGGVYSTEACGWDGGDCVEFNRKYPNCPVNYPYRIGDGRCDGETYNTEACGWDDGDCIEFNRKYPNCIVYVPTYIGDGNCHGKGHGGEYNTEACGWDGGDCIVDEYPDCHVDYPEWIGDGFCDLRDYHGGEEYNTEECKWDGGDCIEFNRKYPNCTVEYPDWIGDGRCNGGEYNTEACGWDGGDCNDKNKILWEKYPNCNKGIYPDHVGDGICYGEDYNTEACGWDGGDCNDKNKILWEKYPNCNKGVYPDWIGNGRCDSWAEGHNIEECGWDGGDCL